MYYYVKADQNYKNTQKKTFFIQVIVLFVKNALIKVFFKFKGK